MPGFHDRGPAKSISTPPPSSEPPFHHSVRDICWRSVRAAADGILRQAAAQGLGGSEEGEVRDRLDVLLDALLSGAESPDASPPESFAPSPLDRHLIELLYHEAVRDWCRQSPPPPAQEMASWLSSFERVRSMVSPPRDEILPVLWTPPPGVDLVVELAHDLRSPLTSIIFLAETLRGGQAGAINDLQRRQLGIIYSAALNLVSTASDVIELSRGGRHLMERRPSPFSLAELLESILDILKPLVEEKGLAMRSSAHEVDQRLGHPVALSRVLLNLASNATKFTTEGFVEIRARATGPASVEFSVIDTGPGIDEGTASQLFEPLRRDPHSQRFGFSGSGLGLAISRRLVAAMGGELRYETEADRGTRFFFELDLPPAHLV